METKRPLGFRMESSFVSKDPDVLAQSAEIAYPQPPCFQRLDVPEGILKIPEIDTPAPEQIRNVSILAKNIEDAQGYIPFLYSYRSVNKAIMRNQTVNDVWSSPDKASESSLDIKKLTNMFKEYLEPTVRKLLELMNFCKQFTSAIVGIATDQKYKKSDVIFEKFVELFDIIFNIDQLKLLKTGISIDLSFYRRALSAAENQNSDMMTLPIWISSKNAIVEDLRKEFINKKTGTPIVERSYKFFSDFLEYCATTYKTRLLIPKKRNGILSAIIVTLMIHSTTEYPNLNIFKCSAIHSIFEILHENPVIPLYGENSFVPGFTIPKIAGFINDPKFPIIQTIEDIAKQEDKFLICKNMKHFRKINRDILPYVSQMSRTGEIDINSLYKLTATLSEMTLAISRQSIFKFVVPPKMTKEVENSTSKYDTAVKHNYTAEDLNALAELIGYVKTLASTTILAETAINECCLTQINHDVQEYIQNTIERPLVRAKAADDDAAVRLIEAIRDLFGQWRGMNPSGNLPLKTKQIKPHKIDTSNVGISAHQLDVLRVELMNIIEPKTYFTKRQSAFTLSHFRPKHVRLTNEFLDKCRDWYYLLDFVPMIRDASNLGFLWFRETYLDIDKVLQFPVRSSLPFILSEHLLSNSSKPALHDSVFFPLELYNDAAAQAIVIYNSQYLYKEIEAEVSLCVDMIAFSFADTFYRFCRETAAAMELPPECINKIVVTPMRYSIMVQQNKLELLGSSIDFNIITTSKLNAKMRKELESYVDMLTDIRLAPFVWQLVRVARTTHSLLVQNHLLMDDFDIIWQKASGFEAPLALSSRISSSIANIIDFPHLKLNCIDRRFLSTKELKLVPPSNETWAMVYAKLHSHQMAYIGIEHISAIKNLLTPGELSSVIQTMIDKAEGALIRFLDTYTQMAGSLRLLPSISKDDIVGYYCFNSDAYSAITHPLLGKLFDAMRVIGNAICFFWYLDNELPPKEESATLMAPIMKRIADYLINNRELFFSEGALDLKNVILHRSFPSIWSVLEFIICSPDPVRLEESKNPVLPLDVFGDGPIITAHVFITLCNQVSLYKFDSMCFRTLELYHAEQTVIMRNDIMRFIYNASIADQCRKLAELISTPYRVKSDE